MTLRTTVALTLAAALSAAVLAGCSDDSSDATTTPTPTSASTSSPGATTTASPADDAVDVDVAITIDGRTITPEPARVKVSVGDTVRLTVTSDIDNALHIHGYDIEAELPAGKAVTKEFVADQAGLFEVETHDEPELLLTQLQVQ